MKCYKILILIMCLAHTALTFAANDCSPTDIKNFKDEYVKLQNALRYSGKNISLKNGKVVANDSAAPQDENAPGKIAEKILYNNYKNALIKVQKIYQHLNNQSEINGAEQKLLADNPEVSKFLKALDPQNAGTKADLGINTKKLLDTLQQVKIPGFTLSKEDTYLLSNLIIHSQDRLCTLSKYNEKSPKTPATQYLEQLKKSPLNKMIESLQSLSGTENLQLSDENIAIDQAVQDSIAKLRSIIKDHKACEAKLKILNIGEVIQECNYDKFIKSLSVGENEFNNFESILHFINANQMTGNGGRTSLDWIDSQFKLQNPPTCYINPTSKAVYVKNMPFTKNSQSIDSTKFSCTTDGKNSATSATCVAGLSFDFEDGLGFKISPKKNSNLSTVTIANGTNCANLALSGTPLPTPQLLSLEDSCKNDPTKEWKDGKCIDRVTPLADLTTCDEKSCTDFAGKTSQLSSWNPNEKTCSVTEVGKSVQNPICGNATAETCKAKKPSANFDSKKRLCIVAIETAESCMAKIPSQEFDKEKNNCIPIAETEASCKAKTPPQEFNKEKNSCIPIAETEASCKAKTPSQEFNKDNNTCIPNVVETEATCKAKTPSQGFDEGKKVCKPLPTAEDKKKVDCDKKIADTGGDVTPGTIYWDEKVKECHDKRDDKKPGDSS